MNKLSNIIKETIAFLINLSCLPNLIRRFIAKKKVTILLYHNPNKKIFERHLKYISQKYNFIKLNNFIDAIRTKKWKIKISYPLIITFDDGHKENFHLIDICKKYKVHPTIYVCTKIVNSNRGYWFNYVIDNNKDYLKKLPDKERKKFLKKNYSFFEKKIINERQSLNKFEMKKMKSIFDFQSHSQYHAILTTCEKKQCYNDIINSRTDLKKILKSEFNHFSYPNGDYSSREINLLEKAKYLSGRTCDVGWNDLNTNLFKLKICLISDDASLNMLKAQISGITGYLRYLTKGSFNGEKKINKYK